MSVYSPRQHFLYIFLHNDRFSFRTHPQPPTTIYIQERRGLNKNYFVPNCIVYFTRNKFFFRFSIRSYEIIRRQSPPPVFVLPLELLLNWMFVSLWVFLSFLFLFIINVYKCFSLINIFRHCTCRRCLWSALWWKYSHKIYEYTSFFLSRFIQTCVCVRVCGFKNVLKELS